MDVTTELVLVDDNIILIGNVKILPGDEVYHIKNKTILIVEAIGEKSGELFHEKGFSFQAEVQKVIVKKDFPLKFVADFRNNKIHTVTSFIVEGEYYMPALEGSVDLHEICLSNPKLNTVWKNAYQDGYVRIIGWSHNAMEIAGREFLNKWKDGTLSLLEVFYAGAEYQKKLNK